MNKVNITYYIEKFKKTKKILLLVKAGCMILKQKRTDDLFFGIYCYFLNKPSLIKYSNNNILIKSLIKSNLPFLNRYNLSISVKDLLELYGNKFDISSLPDDFIYTRRESIFCNKDILIIGEYSGNLSRLAYITKETCVASNYYSSDPRIKHIHSIQKYGDDGKFLVSTGDTLKLLDLWKIKAGGLKFIKRIKKRRAGYSAITEIKDKYFFGSDFSSRPNYIETCSGEKFFFPEKAYNKYVIAFKKYLDRYILSLNGDIKNSGGKITLSIFDTTIREFIFCDYLDELFVDV